MNRCLWIVLLFIATPALAAPPQGGQVQIPLDVYNELVKQGQAPQAQAPTAPAAYAFGHASVDVGVDGESVMVELKTQVKVLKDEWMAVVLLPAGTAVSKARADNRDIQLLNTPAGLAWAVESSGTYALELVYETDLRRAERGGAAVSLVLPHVPGSQLTASIPGTDMDVAVIPSAAMTTANTRDSTDVTASIPTTPGVQLSWRAPGGEGHAISRARYTGSLLGSGVRFRAELTVELAGDAHAEVPLLPASVTLGDVSIDGKPAPIRVVEGQFVTTVRGQGKRRVAAVFEVPVVRDAGPPHVAFKIPQVPVSQLELTLPGDKEISVTPAANVSAVSRNGNTVSTAYLPMSEQIQVSWAEAVPEAESEELLANANIFHLVHAEEGVLYVRAMTVVEVTSGQTNVIDLEIPADVQVSDIRADGGGIKKAIPKRGAGRGQPDVYRVFLDHQLEGQLTFDVFYERKLATGADSASLTIPTIRAAGVHRQRGMVALLASKELTLKPETERIADATRVGDNQLPAFVRQAVDKTVAHTYKYLESSPTLVVQPAPPERREGKFDAQIDTLISLGDVTMKGAATVEVHVKSGAIEGLALGLPAGTNFLSLTAPSLRSHKVLPDAERDDGAQLIDVQFTQEMEGQFRLEVAYEKITTEGEPEVGVPTLSVRGAEVEQGRIAIEALSAVEVGEAKRDQLSPLDPVELPQQLVLKTTNPILRAYKYVQTDPPYALALSVTRHREVDVQKATIDSARYQTLYTRDGLAVTSASFMVRNSREQFLKVRLPAGSKVWSAFVAGQAEKLAIEAPPEGDKGSGDDRPNVLIKIINSAEGFPVELVYETPVSPLGTLGKVSGELPVPDMVVTHSQWEVFLPEDLSYGAPDTNMDIVEQGEPLSGEEMQQRLSELGRSVGNQAVSPLRIHVPKAGVRYAFSKIYANRSDEAAAFAMPYASGGGAWVAELLGLAGTVLFWLGLGVALLQGDRRRGLAIAGGGVLLLLIAVQYLGAGVAAPVLISLLGALAVGVKVLLDRSRAAAKA